MSLGIRHLSGDLSMEMLGMEYLAREDGLRILV